jgi:hypothetical protein
MQFCRRRPPWVSGRGRPLGHLSNGKNHCRPIVSNRSLPQLFKLSSPANPNLRFHRLNRNTGRGLAPRGDPFSQPSGSSAGWADVWLNPISNRKERTGFAPALLPPARFSWSTILLPHAPVLASACVHQLGAHPATGGTRKLSVPGRVHSMPKSCGSQKAPLPPGSNPFLTRGTVESPAKCL